MKEKIKYIIDNFTQYNSVLAKKFYITPIKYLIIMRKLHIPNIQYYNNLEQVFREKLKKYYEIYISNISIGHMAISFESSIFLLIIATILKPKRILDLGSGFTSFIFRFYKRYIKDATVISVDDSEDWLEKTRIFLKKFKLSTENLCVWFKFKNDQIEKFDLISYDLGNMITRRKNLSYILKLAQPKGLIVLDDMQKKRYNLYVKSIIKNSEVNYYDLKIFTLDLYGRYMSILINY